MIFYQEWLPWHDTDIPNWKTIMRLPYCKCLLGAPRYSLNIIAVWWPGKYLPLQAIKIHLLFLFGFFVSVRHWKCGMRWWRGSFVWLSRSVCKSWQLCVTKPAWKAVLILTGLSWWNKELTLFTLQRKNSVLYGVICSLKTSIHACASLRIALSSTLLCQFYIQ